MNHDERGFRIADIARHRNEIALHLKTATYRGCKEDIRGSESRSGPEFSNRPFYLLNQPHDFAFSDHGDVAAMSAMKAILPYRYSASPSPGHL